MSNLREPMKGLITNFMNPQHYSWIDPIMGTFYTNREDNLKLYFTIGIHPYHSWARFLYVNIATVTRFITTHFCIAIGECGLDTKYDVPMDQQVDTFKACAT